MIIEIKIPSPGESVSEVEMASWLVSDGDYVEKDQEIAEVESDKATLPLIAEESGTIKILVQQGQAIQVGTVACTIDTAARPQDSNQGPDETGLREQKTEPPEKDKVKEVEDDSAAVNSRTSDDSKVTLESPANQPREAHRDNSTARETGAAVYEKVKISPLAKKLMEEEGFSISDVIDGLQRITKEDVAALAEMKGAGKRPRQEKKSSGREVDRQKMSMLRRNLSRRLVAVKNETAMLTTFNEVDMSRIISIRKKHQSVFTQKHGVKLGFMSFFTKAVTEALEIYPNVNSFMEGEEIITPQYCDIGIAVQTDKGLMVPVIRNAEMLGLADIEKRILELAEKARKNRISIDDMTGGTFSITNGGIFGSLLSTPILNPPQSGILGMHNIVERPVAIDGRVEIRPMMYIALSYDHRIIDGRDSVGFLVKIKEMLENPAQMLFRAGDPVRILLDI
jgi:2-oxoglutarate dehydrogenase E2 component (dihydrolipoamide succinyltransferase)